MVRKEQGAEVHHTAKGEILELCMEMSKILGSFLDMGEAVCLLSMV